MSDLRLIPTAEGDFDIEFLDGDLSLGEDLETAVIVSLFTWARRAVDDPDPTPGGDQMGWWADETLPLPGDTTGSKWWLGTRSKVTPDILLQLTQWGKDALQWMVEGGIVEGVEFLFERATTNPDRLDILVRLHRPGGVSTDYKYSLNWEAQASRRT